MIDYVSEKTLNSVLFKFFFCFHEERPLVENLELVAQITHSTCILSQTPPPALRSFLIVCLFNPWDKYKSIHLVKILRDCSGKDSKADEVRGGWGGEDFVRFSYRN